MFKREELIEKFSLEGLNKSGGVFDPAKLEWMNGVYIRNLPIDEFKNIAKPLVAEAGGKMLDEQWELLAVHVQERIKTTLEVVPMLEFVWTENLQREMKDAMKGPVDAAKAKEIFEAAAQSLEGLSEFSVMNVETALKDLVAKLDLKMGQVFVPVRIAVTGKKATPPLFESIVALGQGLAVNRLKEAATLV